MDSQRATRGVRAVWAAWLLLAAGTVPAQLQTAGTLLVDLNANAFTTGATVTVWVNNGAAGNAFYDRTPGTDSPTVVARGIARGVDFPGASNNQMLLYGTGPSSPLSVPAQLLGTNGWSVEIWAFNPAFNAGDVTAMVWGDAPAEAVQFSLGTSATGTALDWGNTTLNTTGWQGPLPAIVPFPASAGLTANQWNYYAYVFTGGTELGPDYRARVYLNGVLVNDFQMTAVQITHNPAHPVDNDPALAPFTLGGRKTCVEGVPGFSATVLSASIGQIRVHTGQLTAAQIANNFLLERPNYWPTPLLPEIRWSRPVSGRVIEFGDFGPGGGTEVPVELQVAGSPLASPLTISGYAITGPDAARYTLVPASPPTGNFGFGEAVRFGVRLTANSTAPTSATLTIQTNLGPRSIWLRSNVPRLYVSPSGSDANPGTQAQPMRTLLAALSNVADQPGAVVELAPGVYEHTGNLTDRNWAFRLTAPQGATISGGPGFTRTQSTAPNTSQVVFEGLTVESTVNTGLGVNLSGNWDVTYRNCTITVNSTAASRAGGNVTTTAQIGRLTAEHSSFIGGGGTTLANNGVVVVANQAELTAIDCNFRGTGGSGISFQTTVPTTVTLINCQFGSALGHSADRGIDIDNCGNGTRLVMQNCSFGDVTDQFIDANPGRVSIVASGCSFQSLLGNFGIEWGGLAGQGWVNPEVRLVNCIFFAGMRRHLNLMEGVDLTLIDCIFGPTRQSNVLISGTTGDFPTTVTVVGCTLIGGTSITQGATPVVNPAALNVGSPGGVLVSSVRTDRSTFVGGLLDLGGLGYGSVKRSGGLFVDSPTTLIVTNSVFEGCDVPLHVGDLTTTTAPTTALIYHNTIIRTADCGTSYALILDGPGDTADLRSNIILGGFAAVANVAVSQTTNVTSGDPKFRSPNPFVPPVTVGISDYRPTLDSEPLIIGKGAPIPLMDVYKLDRQGLDRTDPTLNPNYPNHDIGAYMYSPGVNPVNRWYWY